MNFYQITILVAAEGVHKLPAINGGRDVKEALQKLGSIPSSRILVRIKLSLVITYTQAKGCKQYKNPLLFPSLTGSRSFVDPSK